MKRTSELKRTPFRPQLVKEPKRRQRKCAVKSCRALFEPRSITHKTCSPECAILHVEVEKARKESKLIRDRLAVLKPRSSVIRAAQAVFNRFIRERDKDLPCISCGRFHTGAYDAGHYRSVGTMPALRFHEDNVHRQCVPCNQHKGGNIVEYRIRLIERIGLGKVEFLERDHPPAKYSVEEARELKRIYGGKLKALRSNS